MILNINHILISSILVAFGASKECTLKCMRGTCEIGEADFSIFDRFGSKVNGTHEISFTKIAHVGLLSLFNI